ncbi:hypothetical protein [Streptomyces sp. NPDC051079]|uniref:hypothetical protein n=1 Tax=Streptomyces sp. NPDC051079 TaxID=3155043 RepID=UPI00344FB664
MGLPDTERVTLSVEAPLVSAAATVAHRILVERVTRALSDEAPAASSVQVTTALHDATTAVQVLAVTPLDGQTEAMATMLWAQARGLALADPTQEEVTRNASSLDGLAGQFAVDAAIRRELFATTSFDEAGTRAALAAVTPQDVRTAWRRAMERAQLLVPTGPILRLAGLDGRWLWCTTCWTWDEEAPWGQVFRPPRAKYLLTSASRRHWAVLTATSIVSCTAQAYHELRFDDVLALEQWGAERRLIGRCGCTIGLNPAWFRDGHRLIRAVDEAVPPELAFDGEEHFARGRGEAG